MKKESSINLRVVLDENKIPEQIRWDAKESNVNDQ